MVVPSGILLTGRTLPVETVAFLPANKYWPEYVPSAAKKYSVLCLYLYGSLKSTLMRGHPLPGSWRTALTTPLTYPYLSIKSRFLYLGGATLLDLGVVYTLPTLPFLWPRLVIKCTSDDFAHYHKNIIIKINLLISLYNSIYISSTFYYHIPSHNITLPISFIN